MKTSHATFFLSILLMASFSALTHGLVLNGLRISSVSVNGVLFCSMNGNFMGISPALAGAVVQLTCPGSNTNLGQTLTNPAGGFTVALRLLETTPFNPTTCHVRVNLPVATCLVLPPDGSLTAPINLVNIVQSVLGNLAVFTTGPFTHSTP